MVIPQIRLELQRIVKLLQDPNVSTAELVALRPAIAKQIEVLIAQTWRRRHVVQDRKVSRSMKDGTAKAEILELRRRYPHWTQAEIAARVGVDSGRVSETLWGRRR